MIKIRKLVAVDMAWLGARVIIMEYVLGVLLPTVLGLLSIRGGFFGAVRSDWVVASGVWLVSIAANYIPLLIYAVLIANAGTVKKEGRPELAHARRYDIQQFIILIPFFVVVLAIIQEYNNQKGRTVKG